jgi:uncharacterized protein HemX
MLPTNVPDDAPNAASERAEKQLAAAFLPAPEAPAPEKRKAPLPIPSILGLLALVLALAAGAYVFLLQTKLNQLQKDLKQAQFSIQTAGDKTAAAQKTAVESQGNAADVASKLSLLDTKVENKFKGYDDYLTKSLPAELKKVPQLEARMIDENKAIANKNTDQDNQLQELRQLTETNGARLDTVIQVIKRQDSILRTMLPSLEAKPEKKAKP